MTHYVQPTLEDVRTSLKTFAEFQSAGKHFSHLREASVLVGLFMKDGELHTVLTVRSKDTPTNKGEVSLPGGMRSSTDISSVDTALREAEEEIGIPRDAVDVICSLPKIHVVQRRAVTTVVGILTKHFTRVADSREVESIFDVPLKKFLDFSVRHEIRYFYGLGLNTFLYDFIVNGKIVTVYGFTSWMLSIVAATIYKVSIPPIVANRKPFRNIQGNYIAYSNLMSEASKYTTDLKSILLTPKVKSNTRSLRSTLVNYLSRLGDHEYRYPHLRQSCVLVPLVIKDEEIYFLLTKRSANLRTHAGEVALPGGAKDNSKETDEETALRESREEIGLQKHEVDIVGTLPPHFSFPDLSVVPVIGIIKPDFLPKPNPDEVEHVFYVPIDDFRRDVVAKREMDILSKRFNIFYVTKKIGNRTVVIYGLTALICMAVSSIITGEGKIPRLFSPDSDDVDIETCISEYYQYCALNARKTNKL